MGRFSREPFRASGPFVVRVAFRFDGVIYKPNAPFDHIDIDPRRIRLLYQARKLNLGEATPDIDLNTPFDWRSLDAIELLAYAFEKTGTRYRKVERAIHALEDVA